MVAYDYSRALATARRLIERYGRVVALQGVTPGPADLARPLAGPAAPPDPIAGIWAAFVQPSSVSALGFALNINKLFANSEQIALIAPKDTSDYADMKFLYDTNASNRKWVIDHIEKFAPGDTTILYFIGVKAP